MIQHTRSNSTQTEVIISVDRKIQVKDSDINIDRKEFEKYDCFYCKEVIVSSDYLKLHIEKCHYISTRGFPPIQSKKQQKVKIIPPNINPGLPTDFFGKSFPFPSDFPPYIPNLGFGLNLSKCEQCGWSNRNNKSPEELHEDP